MTSDGESGREPARPVLVFGIGNVFRGDDAVGIYVARAVSACLPDGVRVVEHGGEGTSLMEAWRGAETVILCDAVSSGSAPGTIHRWDVHKNRLPANLFAGSTHAFGVAQAIELARLLGQLPARLVVYGIEGGQFELGVGCTPEVLEAVDEVAGRIRRELALSERAREHGGLIHSHA